TPNNSRRDEQSNERGESQFEEEEDNEKEQLRRRRPNQNNQRRHGNRREDVIGGIKIKIPLFQGKSDPKAYLEWKMRVDQFFSFQSYSEGKKRFSQGSKSVDDYDKEMEMTMIRANILEDQKAIVTRFLNELNHDIVDVVHMYPYVELQEMVHQAIKVDQQLQRRNSDELDSRTNLFKEGGNDENLDESNNLQDPLQGMKGPMTRVRAKRVQEVLQCLVKDMQAKEVIKFLPKHLKLIEIICD
ncbi:hypothetical protein CR513_57608, partial [Mucuna pruriens]